MKIRRIVALLLVVVLAFCLVSCKSGKAAATGVVKDFMTGLSTYDLDAMANCVEDFPDNTGTAYIHDIYTETPYADLYKAANANLSYEIASASASEVKLKVKMPNVYELYQKTFMSVLSQALSDEEAQKFILDDNNDSQLLILALMINEIESNGIETTDEEITLKIGKINGATKIMNNDQLATLLSDKLNLSQKAADSSTSEEVEQAA